MLHDPALDGRSSLILTHRSYSHTHTHTHTHTVDIRRDHIVRDTLFQLSGKKPTDLRKHLRISFVREEGVDEGGVQKGT